MFNIQDNSLSIIFYDKKTQEQEAHLLLGTYSYQPIRTALKREK